MSKKSKDNDFDYDAFPEDAKRLLAGESLGGKDGILAPLVDSGARIKVYSVLERTDNIYISG